MSYSTWTQTFNVQTHYNTKEQAEAAVSSILTPIVEAAASLVRSDNADEPRSECHETEAAEQLADSLETEDEKELFSHLNDIVSYRTKNTEFGERITISLTNDSEDTAFEEELFDSIAVPLAKLSRNKFSFGSFGSYDSREGSWGNEFIITKEGEFHSLRSLAAVALGEL